MKTIWNGASFRLLLLKLRQVGNIGNNGVFPKFFVGKEEWVDNLAKVNEKE